MVVYGKKEPKYTLVSLVTRWELSDANSGDLEPYYDDPAPAVFDLENIAHPPTFIPASARLGVVLKQMQSTRTHLAFVIDEHGGIKGIVTLEDLLEEIVGEINDEYDEEVRSQITHEADSTYLVDGMLAVRDANRRFDLNLPENESYTTLAGFLLAQSGRLMKTGEAVEYEGVRFTVERVDRHRIRRVRYTPVESGDEQPTTSAYSATLSLLGMQFAESIQIISPLTECCD
jgi:CBS domain containing-hemolysin-like protein